MGASHQTGWTGIIARILHRFATTNAHQVRELGKDADVVELGQGSKAGRGKR